MKTSSASKIRQAMRQELERSITRLKAPGHPKPYFISYLIRDIDHYNVWACYGSVCNKRREKRRTCYADVRVGSYRYDNTSKGGLTDNSENSETYELIDMPLEDHNDALRFCLWRLTDASYREAVKAFHNRKSRDVSYLDENKSIPSFAKHQAVRSVKKLDGLQIDESQIEQYVKSASAVFKAYPEIKNAYVEFSVDLQTKIFVSSEKVERTWQEVVYRIYIYMWFLTKRCNLDTSLVYNTASFEELPDLERLKKDIKAKVAGIYEIEKGDKLTSYTGPALLAPKAAGLFMHEAVGHRLEGCRLLSDDEGRTFKDKVGEQIMHKDINIHDDPTISRYNGSSLIGHIPYDDEGVKTKRVELVKRGVLKNFLTTRSPLSKKITKSSGHARNQSFERPVSRMANFIVESSSNHSWQDLKNILIKEIISRKLPYGIILLEVEGGETGTEAYNFQAFLGEITKALKVFPDGSEKYVRGVDFVGTPLSSLSHIIAVGKGVEVDNGFCGAESGTVPVSTVSPALLLSSLELQAKEQSRVTQYALPLPWHDKK